MSTTIGEFFVDLVVDAGAGELTIGNLVKSMGELEVASVGEIAILGELANKLGEISDASIKSALAFMQYTSATGGSTKSLQEWQAVAAHVGVKGEEVASIFESVSQSVIGLQKFGVKSDLANLLLPLHMSLDKYKAAKPEQLLKDIRENPFFQAMEPAAKNFVLARAHLDRLARVLSKDVAHGGISPADFTRFQTEAGFMPKRDIENYEKIHSDFTSIWEMTVRIQQVIASWFSGPTLQALDRVVKYFGLVADQFDDRTHPKLGASIVKGETKFIMAGLTGGDTIGMLDQALTNIGQMLARKHSLFIPSGLHQTPEGKYEKSTVVNFHPTLNVSGSHLNEKQLHGVAKKVFDDIIQELPAQIDPVRLR